MSRIQICNTLVSYCWRVVKPFIALLVLYSSGSSSAMGSTLYWMGVDVHGARYGWSMRQASAMLLVPDMKIIAKLYVLMCENCSETILGYSFAMIFIAKWYWEYTLAMIFVCQNIPRYICAWWNMFSCYTRNCTLQSSLKQIKSNKIQNL